MTIDHAESKAAPPRQPAWMRLFDRIEAALAPGSPLRVWAPLVLAYGAVSWGAMYLQSRADQASQLYASRTDRNADLAQKYDKAYEAYSALRNGIRHGGAVDPTAPVPDDETLVQVRESLNPPEPAEIAAAAAAAPAPA